MTATMANDWLATALVALQYPAPAADLDGEPGATPSPAPIDAGLVSALLEANALPSRIAHPSRLEAWASLSPGLWEGVLVGLQRLASGPSSAPALAILHRHVSGAMLRDESLGLGWIEGLGDPALPLCLVPRPGFEALALAAGLVVIGPGIRRVIVRSELAQIENQLGADSMDFVRRVAPRLWAGHANSPGVHGGEALDQARRWGWTLLARALDVGSAPVSRRGRLRLPPDPSPLALPADLADPPQALALCLSVLRDMDAAWLSHFPALH